MLDAPKPFLFHSRDKHSIMDEGNRYVAVIGVDPQNNHCRIRILRCGFVSMPNSPLLLLTTGPSPILRTARFFVRIRPLQLINLDVNQ